MKHNEMQRAVQKNGWIEVGSKLSSSLGFPTLYNSEEKIEKDRGVPETHRRMELGAS